MAQEPSRAFEYAFAAAIATAITGLWIDIWAHIHEATKASETFFTPWHGVMYGGIGVAGLLVGGLWFFRWRRGGAFPPGLELSIVGVLLFGIGGGLDLIWHTLFGVEANLEALLSPTHMMIYVAGFLVFVGPLRMRRLAHAMDPSAADRGWTAVLPAVISVACVFQLVAVFGQFASPIADPFASANRVVDFSDDARTMSVAFGYLGLVVTTLTVSGLVLGFARYMVLPPGSWILILGLSTVGLAIAHDQVRLLPVGLVAGVVAEIALGRADPTPSLRVRAAGALVPFVWSAAYFAIVALTDSLWWTPHIIASGLVLPTFVGFVMSLLVAPPPALTRWVSSRPFAQEPHP
jgi:hypothetical protein